MLSARKAGVARSRTGEADGEVAGAEAELVALSTLATDEMDVWRGCRGTATGRLERNPWEASSDSGEVERALSGAFLLGVLRERKARGKGMWWGDMVPNVEMIVVML